MNKRWDRRWLMPALLFCASVCAGEHPWKDARVGDWCEHKSVLKNSKGAETVSRSRKTVIAREGDRLTVRIESWLKDKKLGSQEMKVDVGKKQESVDRSVKGAKVEALGKGEETIKIGDKNYVCKWSRNRTTVPIKGGSSITESKVWICSNVPMGGVVKSVTKSDTRMPRLEIKSETTEELVACGRGK